MLNWVDNTDDGVDFNPVPIIFKCDVCKKELENPLYWMVHLVDGGSICMIHKACDDGSINCGWIEGCEFMEGLSDRLKVLDAMYSIKERVGDYYIPEDDLVDAPESLADIDEDDEEYYEEDEDFDV